jgi:hypothetical protein
MTALGFFEMSASLEKLARSMISRSGILVDELLT